MVAAKTGSAEAETEASARKSGEEKLDALHKQIKPGTRFRATFFVIDTMTGVDYREGGDGGWGRIAQRLA